MEPYEILVGPLTVWIAPVGESFPDVDTTPSGNWEKLGTNGLHNTGDDGVTVTHEQSITEHRNSGATGPIKVFRTEEGLMIELMLEDLTLEKAAKAFNDVTVTDTAAGSGTPGYRAITLRQGPDVSTFALLARGKSPYDPTMNMDYQIPVVYQSANPAPVFSKSGVAALKFSFRAIEDPNAASDAERFGSLIAQDAVALP